MTRFAASEAQSADDLEYITQCVAGTPYGGWYRVLCDGRLELVALGSVWHQRRRGSLLPQRQARAMLARLVRMRTQRVVGR
jgi:hypothetical protein